MTNLIRRPLPASGFTLIEILVVVAVIGILAGLAIPGLLTAFDRSRQGATTVTLRGYGTALQSYATDNSRFPVANDIDILRPMLLPYSSTLRTDDDWHNPLHYVSDGEHYTIASWGKDGIDGGDISPQTRYVFILDIVFADGAFTASTE